MSPAWRRAHRRASGLWFSGFVGRRVLGWITSPKLDAKWCEVKAKLQSGHSFGPHFGGLTSQNFASDDVCMADDSDQSRALGDLISEAIRRQDLSVRAAAQKIGISDSRLRQIINGRQPVGRGEYIAVFAPEDTLARIALELGISPEELEAVDRGDAAWSLRKRLPDLSSIRPEDRDITWRRIMADHEEIREWAEDPVNYIPPDVILTFFSSSALQSEIARRLDIAESVMGFDWASDFDTDFIRMQIAQEWTRRRDRIDELDRHAVSGQRRPSLVETELIEAAAKEIRAAFRLAEGDEAEGGYLDFQTGELFRQLLRLSRMGYISTTDALTVVTRIRDAVNTGQTAREARGQLWLVQVALMDYEMQRELGPAYIAFQVPTVATKIEQINYRVRHRIDDIRGLTDEQRRELASTAQDTFARLVVEARQDEARGSEIVERAIKAGDAMELAGDLGEVLAALQIAGSPDS